MRLAAIGFAAALVVAGCATEEPEPTEPPAAPETIEEPAPEPAENSDEASEEPPEPPAQEEAAPGQTEGGEPEETEQAAPDPDDGLEQLDGDAVIEASDDGEFGVVAVTDVRLGTHDGFDRIVLEIAGDGVAGWDLRYVDEPTSQGSGQPVEVAGDATLAISLQNVTLPPELPDDIQRWDEERIDGPEGGVVAEVVNDTIFEGIQSFFAGVDDERPFIIERFDDPQRVVIDIPHEG